jgi:hypothetical protein
VRAEEILARVAETYANAAEYGDTCELVMGDARGKFRTSFVRSGRLLFDGELVTDGRTLRFTLDPIASVELAVAELTGVTLGATSPAFEALLRTTLHTCVHSFAAGAD